LPVSGKTRRKKAKKEGRFIGSRKKGWCSDRREGDGKMVEEEASGHLLLEMNGNMDMERDWRVFKHRGGKFAWKKMDEKLVRHQKSKRGAMGTKL